MNCPECNSKIVEGEPFCPVCGIALAIVSAPIVVEPEPVEEFDSTIMMTPAELAKQAALLEESPAIAEQIDIKDIEAPPEPEVLAKPVQTERPKPVLPMIDFNDTASGTTPRPTAEHHFFDRVTAESVPKGSPNPEPSIVSEPVDEPEPLVDSEPIIEEPVIEPEPVVKPERIVELEAEVELALESEPVFEPEPMAEFEPVSDITAEPSISEPVEQVVFEDATETAEPVILAGDSFERVGLTEAPSISEEKPNEANDPDFAPVIGKPSIELPVEDFAGSNPIYDSVRIIAPELPVQEDFISTRIGVSKDLRPSLEAETPEEGIPLARNNPTTPNIGAGGDTDGRKSSKLKPLSEGAILNNRYEIIRKIGGGGMGAVYLASDNNLGGVLRAVKEMVQAHIEEDQQEKSINDFKRESMILSSLDHPSIPTIFDYFYDESEGRFYLVMKYISGGDLSARLRAAPEGKIEELTVTEWALQVIDVLDYLHTQPSTIVYRDLKPSNLMLDGNSGRVMLIDFGIARSISQKEEKGVTAVGTMGYAPPELFSGNVEPRSDIYSLGSTMFHLLTGADPQSNPLLIFDFQKNPRPRQINPRLSDQMEKVLMRSVEYSAEARFGSASEMRQILEQHLSNLKSGNVTYGVSEAPAAVSLEDQFVFCGFCGQRIVATDMFCAFCGAKQPIAQQGVHSGQYVRASATAKLLIEGTTELPMPAFSLQKDENLVGRRDPMSNIFPEVDLSKFDPQTKISRRHARIWRNGDQFLLEDLGSSNGTMLSKPGTELSKITPHQPQILASGDRIRVGDAMLHFVLD